MPKSPLAEALANAKPKVRKRFLVEEMLERLKAEDAEAHRELLKALRDRDRVSGAAIAAILSGAGYKMHGTSISRWRNENLE